MPETDAIANFKEKGTIYHGSQAEVAKWIAENNGEQ